MAFHVGNEFWKFAQNPGRPRSYEPDPLWEKALEYFEWCSSHPWYRKEAVKGGDLAGTLMDIPTARPFTQTGFCVFAGISMNTFDVYSKNPEFQEVTTRIREIMYTQKFEGAVVGAYNANIIARDLGLIEKSETKTQISGSIKTYTGIEMVEPDAPSDEVQT